MLGLSFIRIAVLVALISLWGSLCVLAQAQQSGVGATAKPDTGGGNAELRGRVVSESGQPLPNALVFVSAASANGFERTIATDRDGRFQVNGLDQQVSYYLSATLPAYTTPPFDPSGPPTRPPTYRPGQSVTLTLIKGGVITGTVTNAAGDPLIGIRVRAMMMVKARNGRRFPNGQTRERETDDRGVYRLYGLPPGTYVVSAGGPGMSYSSSVTDPYDSDVPTYAPSSTRDTASEINVVGGEEASGIDIRYRGEQGRLISGVITGTAGETGPNGGFNVALTAAGEPVSPWGISPFPEMNGLSFSFIGVPDGDYDLYAYSFNQSREFGASEVKRIRVRGADLTGIELTPRPLATVAGRVVFEEAKPPVCAEKPQQSFDALTVGAWHNDNEAAKEIPSTMWSWGVPVKPDAEGNFLVHNLATGEYYFGVRNTAKNWYTKSIQFPATANGKKPVDAARVWTSLKAGDRVTGLAITLAQGGASLRGQLAVGEGERVPNRTFVYLAPVERERFMNPLNYYGLAIQPDGKIAIGNIAPGRYWIAVETIDEDVPLPLTRLRFPHDTETRALIRRLGEAAKTEIEFKPCQEVVDFKLPLRRNEP